ncbi:PASTA domain-containing protein [Amphritea sp. 2_MG-2023]|uniref:PASTA domain-containing protein n=1 Tax=Amphritea TaxID=515417 RepID=UPI001C074D79|nr:MULTISPECIES: PASTA domain-containing protein [Amphritea]MBU2965569.1 PASTA domain-containing protein [Amphritea atlantica]MDO6418724.1 PASTA domain-containing protein [Amphritea sp. 2_MG-2023]
MATNIKATLRDSNNKPLANTDAQLFFYTVNGGLTAVASGKSASNGALSMVCGSRFSGFLPRVLLKVKLNSEWVNASNTPKTYSQKTMDFGTIKLSHEPVLTLASTVLYSIPTGSINKTAISSVAETKKFKLLETENLKLGETTKDLTLQLRRQEQTRKTLESELKARPTLQMLNAEKAQVTQLKSQLKQQEDRIKLLERGSGQLREISQQLELKEQQRKKLESELNKRPTLEVLNIEKRRVTELQNQLTLKDNRIGELEGLIKKGSGVVPIKSKTVKSEDLIFSTSDAISRASTKLAKQGGYRISKASVDLKVVAAANQTDLMLFETADDLARIPSNCFGNVRFDIDLAEKEETVETVDSAAKMPNVSGYTRQLAERKLGELQDQVFWYEQQLSEKDPFSAGQIMSQHPKANTPLQPDTQIILIIGV